MCSSVDILWLIILLASGWFLGMRGFHAWPNSVATNLTFWSPHTKRKGRAPYCWGQVACRCNAITSFVTSLKKQPTVCNPLKTFLKVATFNPPLQLLYYMYEWQSRYISLHSSFESRLDSQLWHNTVGSYLLFKILYQTLSCINGVTVNSFTLNTLRAGDADLRF